MVYGITLIDVSRSNKALTMVNSQIVQGIVKVPRSSHFLGILG